MTMALKQIKYTMPLVSSSPTLMSDTLADLIDDIGAMLPAVEAKQKMIKALQGELQPYADKMKVLTALLNAIDGPSPDHTFRYQGTQFIAMVGKGGVVRRVTNPALAIKLPNRVEKGIAWQVITVPLGKLDAYLTPEERSQVVTVDRGERTVLIVKKPCQEAA